MERTPDAGETPSETPSEAPSEPWLVIGMGNPWRGDDAAGLHVVRRLRRIAPAGLRTRTCTGGADTLLDLWSGAATVVVVDAVVSGAEPGSILWLDATAGPLPADWQSGCSTHALGLHEAIRLGGVLHRLPETLTVCGIEVSGLGLGQDLSDPVRRGVERAVTIVLERWTAATRQRAITEA